jgi:hypothetical protein
MKIKKIIVILIILTLFCFELVVVVFPEVSPKIYYKIFPGEKEARVLSVGSSQEAGIQNITQQAGQEEIDTRNIIPTDFSEVGNVEINNPGLKQDVLYFVYEEPGKPALTKELTLDDLSMQVFSNRASVIGSDLKNNLVGKRVALEGIEDDGKVLVRKITEIKDGDNAIPGAIGSKFISWHNMVLLLNQCQASKIVQYHSLDVYSTLESGEVLRAVEPGIDDVFNIYQNIKDKCGEIILGTE